MRFKVLTCVLTFVAFVRAETKQLEHLPGHGGELGGLHGEHASPIVQLSEHRPVGHTELGGIGGHGIDHPNPIEQIHQHHDQVHEHHEQIHQQIHDHRPGHGGIEHGHRPGHGGIDHDHRPGHGGHDGHRPGEHDESAESFKNKYLILKICVKK